MSVQPELYATAYADSAVPKPALLAVTFVTAAHENRAHTKGMVMRISLTGKAGYAIVIVGISILLSVLQTPFGASAISTPPPPPELSLPSEPLRPQSGRYVALGDSVAAGAGLPASSGSSDQPAICGQSTQAYPYVVAAELDITVAHIACSGARVGDLVTEQDVDEGEDIAAQLPRAFTDGNPALITVTAGANDIRWNSFLRACYRLDACDSTAATRISNAYIYALKAKLYYVLYNIQFRSGGTPPTVILTGYYTPLSPACAEVQNDISGDEISWINRQTAKLNRTIERTASRFNFAYFAPVSFKGHELCSPEPWVQSPEDPAPFHPTARGQQAIAASVVETIRRTDR